MPKVRRFENLSQGKGNRVFLNISVPSSETDQIDKDITELKKVYGLGCSAIVRCAIKELAKQVEQDR